MRARAHLVIIDTDVRIEPPAGDNLSRLLKFNEGFPPEVVQEEHMAALKLAIINGNEDEVQKITSQCKKGAIVLQCCISDNRHKIINIACLFLPLDLISSGKSIIDSLNHFR